MDCGLGIHALDGNDVSQCRVGRWLWKIGYIGVLARKVADEVEVLAVGCCDAK